MLCREKAYTVHLLAKWCASLLGTRYPNVTILRCSSFWGPFYIVLCVARGWCSVCYHWGCRRADPEILPQVKTMYIKSFAFEILDVIWRSYDCDGCDAVFLLGLQWFLFTWIQCCPLATDAKTKPTGWNWMILQGYWLSGLVVYRGLCWCPWHGFFLNRRHCMAGSAEGHVNPEFKHYVKAPPF